MAEAFKPNVSCRWEGSNGFSVSFPSGPRDCDAGELAAAVKAAAKAWRDYYEKKRGGSSSGGRSSSTTRKSSGSGRPRFRQ